VGTSEPRIIVSISKFWINKQNRASIHAFVIRTSGTEKLFKCAMNPFDESRVVSSSAAVP